MKKFLLLISGMILWSQVISQNFVNDYDSLLFPKPEARKLYYKLPLLERKKYVH